MFCLLQMICVWWNDASDKIILMISALSVITVTVPTFFLLAPAVFPQSNIYAYTSDGEMVSSDINLTKKVVAFRNYVSVSLQEEKIEREDVGKVLMSPMGVNVVYRITPAGADTLFQRIQENEDALDEFEKAVSLYIPHRIKVWVNSQSAESLQRIGGHTIQMLLTDKPFEIDGVEVRVAEAESPLIIDWQVQVGGRKMLPAIEIP